MSLRALAPLLLSCALLLLPPAPCAAHPTPVTASHATRLHNGDRDAVNAACDVSSFNVSLAGSQCFGLSVVAGVASEAACAAACCASARCQLYEFCPPGTTCGGYAGPSCWTGAAALPCPASSAGWLGRSRP